MLDAAVHRLGVFTRAWKDHLLSARPRGAPLSVKRLATSYGAIIITSTRAACKT